MEAKNFELVFVGGISKRYIRWHDTFDQALREAVRTLRKLEDRAAHTAIIYGPECRKDGITIA